MSNSSNSSDGDSPSISSPESNPSDDHLSEGHSSSPKSSKKSLKEEEKGLKRENSSSSSPKSEDPSNQLSKLNTQVPPKKIQKVGDHPNESSSSSSSSTNNNAQPNGSLSKIKSPTEDKEEKENHLENSTKKSSSSKTTEPGNSSTTEPCPVLSGEYKLDHGLAFWSGTWAFSEAALAVPGQNSKFSYRSRATAGAVSLKGPVNGIYDGFFNFKALNASSKKIEEKGTHLSFTKKLDNPQLFDVKGNGTNVFGTFDLSGTFNSQTNLMKVWKNYTS